MNTDTKTDDTKAREMANAFKPLADAATAVMDRHGIEPAPTVDDIVADYIADQELDRSRRVNVFEQCVHNGQVSIDTEASANEIAKLMNRAASDLENTKATAAAMVARAEQRVKSLDFLFKLPLQVWTTAKLIGKKTRSLLLPAGKLALRTVPESTHFVDDKATLQWALLELPSAVEMVPKLKLEVVKEWEAANGKAAPGRELTPAHDSFKVSIPK